LKTYPKFLCGGFLVFWGLVRNRKEDGEVSALWVVKADWEKAQEGVKRGSVHVFWEGVKGTGITAFVKKKTAVLLARSTEKSEGSRRQKKSGCGGNLGYPGGWQP